MNEKNEIAQKPKTVDSRRRVNEYVQRKCNDAHGGYLFYNNISSV